MAGRPDNVLCSPSKIGYTTASPQDEGGVPHRGAAITLTYHCGGLLNTAELLMRCDAAAERLGLRMDAFSGAQARGQAGGHLRGAVTLWSS